MEKRHNDLIDNITIFFIVKVNESYLWKLDFLNKLFINHVKNILSEGNFCKGIIFYAVFQEKFFVVYRLMWF